MSAATDFARLQRLPPQEAIAYMQGRELVGETFSAYDLWQDQHGRAFTISRLARADLLEALQKSLAQSVAGDLNRKDWIDNAEKLLKNAGWWGSKEVTDPRTGELLKTRFNHARLQLIFDTNVRQAQAAGQWQRLLRNRRIHPYARYVCMDDDRVRPLHRSWHNVTLPLDDPWWQTHRPPNGYRCRCRIIGVSQRDYDRGEVLSRPGAEIRGEETGENAPIVRQPMRKTAPQDGFTNWTNPSTGEVKRIPAGIDPGFDYNAGTVGESQAFKALIERKLAALEPGVREAASIAGLLRTGADLPHLSALQKTEFTQWAQEVLQDDYRVKNDYALVGFLPQEVLADMQVIQLFLQGTEIHISDKQLRHGYRPGKKARGAALPADVLAVLPEKLEGAAWYFDATHGNVFAVFDTEGGNEGEVGKAVVQFNYTYHRQTYNAVITTGVIQNFNLNGIGIRRIK